MRLFANLMATMPGIMAILLFMPYVLSGLSTEDFNSYVSAFFLFNFIWIIQRGGTDISGPKHINFYGESYQAEVISVINKFRILTFILVGLPSGLIISRAFEISILFCFICALVPVFNYSWFIRSYCKPKIGVFISLAALVLSLVLFALFKLFTNEIQFMLIAFPISNAFLGYLFLVKTSKFSIFRKEKCIVVSDSLARCIELTISQVLPGSAYLVTSLVLPSLITGKELALVLFFERLIPNIGLLGTAMQNSLNSLYQKDKLPFLKKALTSTHLLNVLIGTCMAILILYYASSIDDLTDISAIIVVSIIIRSIFFNYGLLLTQKIIQQGNGRDILKINGFNFLMFVSLSIILSMGWGHEGTFISYSIVPLFNFVIFYRINKK